MELKRYLEVIRQRWMVVVGVAIATVLFTAFFVAGGSAVYESNGTYIVRPLELDTAEAVRATDALNRGTEINSTYARIVRSDIVKARAKNALQTVGVATSGLSVRSAVLPDTNIIEITASGHEPGAVAAYANAVGEEAIDYLVEVDEVYRLQLLDQAEVPRSPLESSDTLTMIVGLFLGLLAGSVVAFSVEYFSETVERPSSSMRIYDRVTGAYNSEFFKFRFRQEWSRCSMPVVTRARWGVSQRSFSLGVMRITVTETSNGSDVQPRPADLRDAAQALLPDLRVEDLLAYLGDNTFAVLLPDMPVDAAEELLIDWSENLESAEGGRRRGGAQINVSIGVCSYGADGFLGDEKSIRLAQAL